MEAAAVRKRDAAITARHVKSGMTWINVIATKY